MASGQASVNVVAVGARTPVGLRASFAAAAVRAGISRIAEHPFLVDSAGEPMMVAMDSTLEPDERVDRLKALLISAVDEALENVTKRDTLPVFIALPERNDFFTQADERNIIDALAGHLRGRFRADIHGFAKGNAAGLLALQQAFESLRTPASHALVAGVDSKVERSFLMQLDASGRLASLSNQWGYPPGEGGGAALLTSADPRTNDRSTALMRVASVATGVEKNVIYSDTVNVGAGLTQVFRQAIESSLKSKDATVTAIYCDVNGERYRTQEYLYASTRVDTYLAAPTKFTTGIDCWGDVGAAAGPLLVSLAFASADRGYAEGSHALVWASSESGLRGAAVFELSPRPVVVAA
ncbi:MAG: hypothetical protein JNG84_10340 [Archangium sp.]|nr:hypothetical protein [Archangium sp.]